VPCLRGWQRHVINNKKNNNNNDDDNHINNSNNTNSNNTNTNLQAFQLIVPARYLLGVPKP